MKQNKRFKESDLDYKKRVLDNLSPSFCGAKWYNATIWLGSGRTTSCHHPPAHEIELNDVLTNYKVLHNTPQKKEDRRKMINGERPAGCEYCWKIEDMYSDKVSDRAYKSMIYTDEELRDAFNSDPDDDFNLKTLEIAFDRTCQFACSYCNPSFSTTWIKDIKTNGGYKDLKTDGGAHFDGKYIWDQLWSFGDTNPYIEAFFKWWEADLHKTLMELRITGGEPLMSGHTWKLLDWFKENKNKSKTDFSINSNLGFEKEVLDRMLDSLDGVVFRLYSSNESVGAHAEYIRDGLNWVQWEDNMIYLLESGKLRKLNVMGTVNALCLESLTDMMDLVLAWKRKYGQRQVAFSLNILRFPSFQGPLVLPDHLKDFYRNKLQTWYDKNRNDPVFDEFEKNHLERLIDYLDKVEVPHGEEFNREIAEKDFKLFYQQYDQRRNKKFHETFSKELVDWYNSINV